MKMTIRALLRILMILVLCGFHCSAQLLKEPSRISVTGVADPNLELICSIDVDFQATDGYLMYGVGVGLNLTRGFGHLLRYQSTRDAFPRGGVVGPNSLIYTNPTIAYTWLRPVHSYSWEVRFPGNQIFIYPAGDDFPGQTNILIGFVRQHPVGAGNQYGWVRLEREIADPRNVFREDGSERQVTFMPTGFAVHPIPDQPIRAGEPPDLPQLVTEVLPPEEGLPTRVRVSWAAGWASMRLESAVELANPVQWSPVFGVNGTEAVFELPEDGQLYLRLAYAP
jgi:hypothetical protein